MYCSERSKKATVRHLMAGIVPVLLFSSCDILNMSALEVVSWSPGKEVVQGFTNLEIGVTFSSPVDRLAAETAFSLRKDGTSVAGTFDWSNDDKRLKFTTWEPLDPDFIYEISVESSVEDIYGNSIREKFTRKFGTFSDIERPSVLSIVPDDDEIIDQVRQPIIVTFSESISPDSWFEAINISPSIEGSVVWNSERTIFEFVPAEDLVWQQEYTIRVSTQLRDLSGNRIGKEFVSRFKIGSDTIAPELSRITDVATESKDLTSDDPSDATITLNYGWATTDSLLLVFSEPIDTHQILSFVSLNPPNHFAITDTTRYQDEVELSFDARFANGVTYTLTIDGRLEDVARNKLASDLKYYIVFDAPETAPPVLNMENDIAFSSGFEGGEPTDIQVLEPGAMFEHSFPIANSNLAFFDFLISVADSTASSATEAAAIMRNSFLSAFDITATNSAANFDILGAYVNPPSGASDGTFTDDEVPIFSAGQNEIVVRVYVLFTPQASAGVITISIAEGFDDGTGNVSSEAYSVQYNYF